MGKGKFCYSFDEEFYRGKFNTVEEALAAASECNDDREYVYVGKAILLDASAYVDVDKLLEDTCVAAQDQCGEVADEYLMHWSEEEKDVLKKIICEHLEKVDPVTFSTVERIATFRFVDGKAVRETDS